VLDTTTLQGCIDVLEAFYTLDRMAVNWKDIADSNWEPIQKAPLDFREMPGWVIDLYCRPGAPHEVFTYEDIPTAYAWNLYRLIRIIIYGTILNLTRQIRNRWADVAKMRYTDLSPGRAICRSMVEDIRCSILFHYTVAIPGKPETLEAQDICGLRTFLLIIPLDTANVCMHRLADEDESLRPEATWTTLMYNYSRRMNDKLTPWADGKPASSPLGARMANRV
jgi:hypothetical protein